MKSPLNPIMKCHGVEKSMSSDSCVAPGTCMNSTSQAEEPWRSDDDDFTIEVA
jgi:hypothetical protein